jgi:crossover junction endodeoxyribonuclease RuvC
MFSARLEHRVRVVGIDPGLRVTGYGVLDGEGQRAALVEAGTVSADESGEMAERLRCIHDDVLDVFRDARPDAVAVEKLYAHYSHPTTAIVMGHARGVILLAAAECGVPVLDYPATMIKRSLTGNGHATKAQMQQMVAMTLGLNAPPEPPDVADALAVALCHLNAVSKPVALGRR